MAHIPINHPARPIYRAIGGLVGLYLVIFGGFGLVKNSGAESFAQDDTLVLGQGSNLAHAVLCLVLGLGVLGTIAAGRNLDAVFNKWLGRGFVVFGLLSLALLRTEANYFNFTVSTCIVSMLTGLVLMMVGLYVKVGTEEEARAAREARLLL